MTVKKKTKKRNLSYSKFELKKYKILLHTNNYDCNNQNYIPPLNKKKN